MDNDERDALERKKLALEITDLERIWWKRPTYILAALPTLLAITALSVGFLNGFFSAQLTKLDNQKHDLEAQVKDVQAQIKDFEARRDALYAELNKLDKSVIERNRIIKRVSDLTVDMERKADQLELSIFSAPQCARERDMLAEWRKDLRELKKATEQENESTTRY